jgi:NADP-dependent 3-hydroxy acid dehydrogenase YdfG
MIGPLHAASSPDGANTPRPLEGRFVLVVGASSEAGSACVDHFQQEGAKVIPAGMMYSVFERGFPWLPGNEIGLGVCDTGSWEAVVQLIEKACGYLDLVVNCAPFTFEVTGRSDRATWAGRSGEHIQSVHATMAACMPLLGKERTRLPHQRHSTTEPRTI